MSNKAFSIRIATRLHRNTLWSTYLNLTGNNLRGRSWVFIIGCYNSGTTLLEEILSHHPEISGLSDEGVMLTDALPRPEDFGWRRMWHQCENEMLIGLDSEAGVATRIKRQWSHFYRKKKYLIEKSISNTPRALFFERNFQPAYFIHIVRNGYAVAEGIMRKAKTMKGNPYYEKSKYPIEICAQQWKRNLQVVAGLKDSLTNFIEVRYEDLTERPLETMLSITSFLNVKNIDEEIMTRKFSVHQSTEPIMNMNNRSIAKLSQFEIDKINEVAFDYLMEYGYYQAKK